MSDDDFRDDIARLEERVEALTAERERCRKISFAAKLAIGAGAIWIVLVLVTLIPFAPATFFGAMAAVIGGTVLLGSNKTTWEQTETALHAAENMRAQLIGRMELRVVGEERPTIH